MWDLYREDKALENSQYSFLTRPAIDGYVGYEKEQLRQTILKQESVFRHQLQELHRLYKNQRDLMNECSRNELSNHPTVEKTSQRRMFDLELPADLYDEGIRQVDRINDLADLNEPIQVGETYLSAPPNILNNNARVQEELVRRDVCKNTNSGFWFSPQGFSQNLFAVMEGGIHPNYKHLESDAKVKEQSTYNFKAANTRSLERTYLHGDHSSTLSKSVQVEHGKSRESLPFPVTNQPKIEPQRKRTIFGVEISEGTHQPSSSASQSPNSHLSNPQFNVVKSESIFKLAWRKTPHIPGENLALQDNGSLVSLDPSCGNNNSMRQYHEFLQGKIHLSSSSSRLPWLLPKPLSCAEQINGKGSPYQMNLDSLQNHSPQFFKKAELIKGPTQVSSKDSTSLICACDSESAKIKSDKCQSVTKILGFPVVDVPDISNPPSCLSKSTDHESNADEVKGLNKYISGRRHHIDLNLALNEDESQMAPSFSKAVVKIATTEIDLEAPAVLESEEPDSQKSYSIEPPPKLPVDSLSDSQEEITKVAAEALMTISSLSYQSLGASASDLLLWFADVVSSENVKEDLVKPDHAFDEKSIPEGMDEFELMSLKLKDTKEEEYNCSKSLVENENGGAPSKVAKRPRRGQGKRGRQRKDFQRDVLPSLVSLARREVTEDLQTFEEAFTAIGDPWQSSISKRKAARNGRGRKRLVDPSPAPLANAEKPLPPRMPASCREVALEEKSLSGWGKRTRRIPRQRCINTSHPLALKC